MILTLRGNIPAKKSKYRSRCGGGLYLDAATRACIEGLAFQAGSQWRRSSHEPVEHPVVTIRMHARQTRADRDGKLVTLLDVLQQAGVIRNDNINRFNGWLHLAPVEPALLDDYTEVEIEA